MVKAARPVSRQAAVARAKPKYHGKLARALASLNQVLAEHIRYDAQNKKVVGNATKADRRNVLSQAIRDLHAAGYKIEDVRHFSTKHLKALVAIWEARQYSASTLQKRFSVLNVFCGWIGKGNLIGDSRSWLSDPKRFGRVYAAERDNSWTGQGVEIEAVLTRVQAKDPVVAVQLRLAQQFGLRSQEAMLLRPQIADRGEWLEVTWGTKGGRPRRVPIATDAQRQALEEAKRLAPTSQASTIPAAYTLKSWLNHYYYVLKCCGITRRDGIVAHGLRHGYANDRYEELAGCPSPVRGGTPQELSREEDRAARLAVSGELGHARERITSAYYGKVQLGRHRAVKPGKPD